MADTESAPTLKNGDTSKRSGNGELSNRDVGEAGRLWLVIAGVGGAVALKAAFSLVVDHPDETLLLNKAEQQRRFSGVGPSILLLNFSLISAKKKQVTWGHNIIAEGWAGACNPIPTFSWKQNKAGYTGERVWEGS